MNSAGGAWTFTGTAGIAHNGSSLNNPDALVEASNGINLGTQVAFIQGIDGVNGSMTTSFTIPENALPNEVYSINFKAVNRKKAGAPSDDTQKVKVYMDGVDICQRTFSQSGGYQPPGYNTGYKWKARNVFWVWSDYYFTKVFNAAPGTTHTLRFDGISTSGDQMIFIDDVRVSSASAIINSKMPYSGQATGQTSIGQGYLYDMAVASIWAKTFGLHYITYEGGWSLGGDDGGSALQNYVKFELERTKNVQIDAIDLFHKANGKVNVYGTYKQWPSWDENYPEEGMLNISKYPIMQGIVEGFRKLPAELSIGAAAPGTVDGANCLEKSFGTGTYLYLRGAYGATATYAVRAEQSGDYSLSFCMNTVFSDNWLNVSVNQGQKQAIKIPCTPFFQQPDGFSNSIPYTIQLNKGLNIIKVYAKDLTDTNIRSMTITSGAAPQEIPNVVTLGNKEDKDIKLPLTGKYSVGDVITLRATDYTFKSVTSGFSGIATAELATVNTANDALKITCKQNGLVMIKAPHNGGRTANIYLLIGYNYPQGIEAELSPETSAKLPLVVSSANQYFSYRNLFNGMVRSKSFQTAKGLNNQYVIRRLDDLYQLDNLQLYIPVSTTYLTPESYRLELCAEPFPNGYVANNKLLVSGAKSGSVNTVSGDFTDYYSFASGTNFGSNVGVILPSFEEKINGWNWKTVYEGSSSDFLTDAHNSFKTAFITKEKMQNYVQENGLANDRAGYFVKISFSNSNIPNTTNNFCVAAIAMDAQKVVAPLEISLLPRIENNVISSVEITNAGGALSGGVLIIGRYNENYDLIGTHLLNTGSISSQGVTSVNINVDLTGAYYYKLFLWNNIGTIEPLSPPYSAKVDGV